MSRGLRSLIKCPARSIARAILTQWLDSFVKTELAIFDNAPHLMLTGDMSNIKVIRTAKLSINGLYS
jgi:hypothetical protein